MTSTNPKKTARPHAFPGTILMGAESRLLPYDVPLRYFVAAAFFHVLAWVLLSIGFEDVAGFIGGPGYPLAALHALTLGVFAMTAAGASLQLLSVATGVALKSHRLARMTSWFLIPGTGVLLVGMIIANPHVMMMGGVVAAVGLCLFLIVLSDIFRRAETMKNTVRHGWAALLSLGLLIAAGIILIADFELGFLGQPPLPDHSATALVHAILGSFGFMGLLALGFSYVLVPMFALSHAPNDRSVIASFVLVIAGLTIAIVGALMESPILIVLSASVGGGGVAIHLYLMVHALRTGMKKRLGLSFIMVRASWVLLVISICIGAAAALVDGDGRLITLFGFVLTFGWLLTFLTGIAGRILPFLTSMHAHKIGQRAPRLSAMGHQSITLNGHALCHGAAVILISGGIAAQQDYLVLAGAVFGTLGALAFLWFALAVARIVISFHEQPNPSE